MHRLVRIAVVLALVAGAGRAHAVELPTPPRVAAATLVPHWPAHDPADDPGDSTRWFYSGLTWGSEALVHPVRLVVNGGFGILQFDDRENRLGRLRLGHGWRRVWNDLRDPVGTIEAGGWDDFVRRELLPVSTNRKSAQYWPNYTLHLIGGGMSYAAMREWYQQHGSRHPSASASATLTAYHVLNEIVEAESRTAPSTDAIADLLVFDPAGIALFSRPRVARFFGEKLRMRDWSTQPAFDPVTGAIENQGQNFSIKVPLPRTERWRLFYYFGNHGEGGLTYTRPDGAAFSLGAGLRARALVELGQGVQTADLVPSFGFFYDRDGSLLFSVTSANTSRYRVRVNAYPGLVRAFGRTVGLFLLERRDGGFLAGIHTTAFPLGLAGKP